jgi:uncharacterized SAM-binding protein YcdF (DUF218 family)
MLKFSYDSAVSLMDHKYIQNYLLIEQTQLRTADIILIFGNQHCIHKLSKQAAFLYHQGYAPKIIASGGRTVKNNSSEAELIKNSLLADGVRYDDILVENRSTNTQENIMNSKEIIISHFPNQAIKSVIGIGTIVAGRRFLMTLEKNWPDALSMVSNVNPFDTPINEWITNPDFQKVVLAEYNKIRLYIEKGFIDEINIGTLNHKIQSFLKTSCQLSCSKA